MFCRNPLASAVLLAVTCAGIAAAPRPAVKPSHTLSCKTTPTWKQFRQGQPLVFEGLSRGGIHRPGPEHFKITRVSDGKAVRLRLAYDQDKVQEKARPGKVRPAAKAEDKTVYAYNAPFKGARLSLYNGRFAGKDLPGREGILDLYGCPPLEAGVRYRLTRACWPVGAAKAVEVTCDFVLPK